MRAGLCVSLALTIAIPAAAAKQGGKNKNSSTTASTQDATALSKEIGDVNGLEGQATQTQLQKALVDSVAKEAGVTEKQLKQDKQKSAMGYGDLLVGEAIAQSSKSTFDDVQKEHANRNWADCAQAHNVPLKTLVTKLQAVQKDFDKEQKDLAKQEREQQQLQQAKAKAAQERRRRR